jgi:hypothetical protein
MIHHDCTRSLVVSAVTVRRHCPPTWMEERCPSEPMGRRLLRGPETVLHLFTIHVYSQPGIDLASR